MTELKALQALKQRYSQLQENMEQVLIVLREGRLFSSGQIPALIFQLENADREQQSCCEQIEKATTVRLRPNLTVKELQKVWTDYQEKQQVQHVQKAKRIFADFARLYPDNADCNAELKKLKTLLAFYSDEQIAALNFETDIQPYCKVVSLIDENDLNVIGANTKTLKDFFNDALLMGLFFKSIHLRPAETISDEPQNAVKSEPANGQSGRVVIATNPTKETSGHKPQIEPVLHTCQRTTPAKGTVPFMLISPDVFRKMIEETKKQVLLYASAAFPFPLILPGAGHLGATVWGKPSAHYRNVLVQEARDIMTDANHPKKLAAPEGKAENVVHGPSENEPPLTAKESKEDGCGASPVKIREQKAFADPLPQTEMDKSRPCLREPNPGKADVFSPFKPTKQRKKEQLSDYGITLDMAAHEVAGRILEAGITPQHPLAYEHLMVCLLREGKHYLEEDRIENSLAQTVVLSQTLAMATSSHQLQYKNQNQRLALAVDSPLGNHSYTGNNIVTLFDGEMQGTSFHLAALLRALFAPDMQHDYSLYAHAEAAFENYEQLFNTFPMLKPLYNLFLRIHSLSQNGFSVPVLRRFGDARTEQQLILQIRSDAKQLLREPVIKSHINALIPMKAICFGPDSELRTCMETILVDNRADRDMVKMVFDAFCETDGGDKQVISQEKIKEVFERNWKRATEGIRAPRELISIPRAKIVEGINDRLSVMEKWLEATEDSDEKSIAGRQFSVLRSEIISEINRVLPEISANCTPADNTVFTAILERIHERLDGHLAEDYTDFADFLRTGIFETNANGLPVIDGAFSSIEYYEPWRNALRHIAAPVVGLTEVLSNISSPAYPQFDNIGQAIAICRLLNAHCGGTYSIEQYEDDTPRAKRSAERTAENFRGKLESAFAYGRISETQKEDILGSIDLLSEHFDASHDYGCLRAFLAALQRSVDDATQQGFKALQQDIDNRKSTAKRPELEAILGTASAKLQPPEQNFVVAEEYINRFDAGIVDKLDGEMLESSSFLLRFLSSGTFDGLYELCRKSQSLSLRHFGWPFVEQTLRKRKISSQYQESSKSLIASLPNRPDEVSAPAIVRLLTESGFSALRAKVVSSSNTMVHVAVEVQPDSKDKAEYAHPVDLMGTKLQSPLDVVCLFGKMQPNDIVDKVCGLELNRTVIVFLNGAMDLFGRRQIAERFHRRKSGQNPFLLAD